MCCLLLNTECCIQNMFCLFIHVIFKILNHFKFVLLKLCLKDLLLCGLDVTTLRFAYEEMGDGGGRKMGEYCAQRNMHLKIQRNQTCHDVAT